MCHYHNNILPNQFLELVNDGCIKTNFLYSERLLKLRIDIVFVFHFEKKLLVHQIKELIRNTMVARSLKNIEGLRVKSNTTIHATAIIDIDTN